MQPGAGLQAAEGPQPCTAARNQPVGPCAQYSGDASQRQRAADHPEAGNAVR